MRAVAALILAAWLAACSGAPDPVANLRDKLENRLEHREQPHFPAADRPVASIVSSRWSNEEARDRLNEAAHVMDLSGIKPGMTVADIGAGEGYYTIRLGQRVGEDGRVLAEDIVPQVRDALAERVARERLDNVSVRLGLPADPRLPPGSFDRVLMVHMYHEIGQPYEFLWRLRPALKPGGEVVVVDADRATQMHGTPPTCCNASSRRSAMSACRTGPCRRLVAISPCSVPSGRGPSRRRSCPAACQMTPAALRLILPPRDSTTCSTSGASSAASARASRRVTRMSASLGRGSPDG